MNGNAKGHLQSDEMREELHRRLNRLEGQVQGVRRMLDDDRDCREIVQQLAAVRSAAQQAGLALIRAYAAQCLHDPSSELSDTDVIDYLVGIVGKWS